MTYTGRESECALEGYQWCGRLCFLADEILEGNCPPQVPTSGRHRST